MTMKEVLYQVGIAEDPAKDDPRFRTIELAIKNARKWGDKYPDTVYAIWDVADIDTTHVVYLLFQGDLYQKY